MQCAVRRATMCAPFDTFGFVESLFSALSLLSPKVLGFHFLWSISHYGSFSVTHFPEGAIPGRRLMVSKPGPVILSQQTTIWGEAVLRKISNNVIYRIAIKMQMLEGPSILVTLYYTCAYQRIGPHCVMQPFKKFSGHMCVLVCIFACHFLHCVSEWKGCPSLNFFTVFLCGGLAAV